MYDIVALGELLIDFSPYGHSETGMKLLEMNPGGAVANVLCAASKLGHSTAFIGKVGEDAHGRYLRSKLVEYGINADGLRMSAEQPTTLAFVDIADNGERSFSFFRNPGADTQLRADELPVDIIGNAKIFHVGSLSMTNEPARTATVAAIELAKESGAIITYDPNYRAMLWESEQTAEVQMRSLLPYIDFVKISDNETALVTGESEPESAIRKLISMGIRCAVVTAGEDGCIVGVGEKTVRVPGFKQSAVDTTGAGDSFWGGFLTAFIERGKNAADITAEDAAVFARFGNAVAACCVMGRGAMPAMPDRESVEAILKES